MSLSALAEAIQAFARSLSIKTIFPAGLFVVFHVYFILPKMGPDIKVSTPGTISLIIALTLTLSYLLFVFSSQFNILFRGKGLEYVGLWCWRWRLRTQLAEFQKLRNDIDKHQNELLRILNDFELSWDEPLEGVNDTLDSKTKTKIISLRANIRDKNTKLETIYPPYHQIRPTAVGNVIVLFQNYPKIRYGMDWNALWPRFAVILKEKGYYEHIARYEDAFDFLKNTWVIVIVLGLELFYLNLYSGQWLSAFASIGLALALALFSYNGMIMAASQWGVAIRVAFDLYRNDLSEALGLIPSQSFSEERDRWQRASAFFGSSNEYVGSVDDFMISARTRQSLQKIE
jgi:hypothetical protein